MLRTRVLLASSVLLCVCSASAQLAPKFSDRQDYVGLFTQWVGIADTNQDGIPDMITTDQGYIFVLLGNGDGTFRQGWSGVTNIGASEFHQIVDLNGDGIPDIVFAGLGTSGDAEAGISVSLGNGDGTFQFGTFYGVDTYQGYGAVALADFNGDGKLDAVFGDELGVWFFVGNGDGTFQPGALIVPVTSPYSAAEFAIGDYNGDGKMDFVVTLPIRGNGKGDGFDIVYGNGDGTFQTPSHYFEPRQPLYLAAGPLTKSGRAGFVMTAEYQSDALVYISNGKGGFTITEAPISGPIVLGDVNGDGYPDIINSSGEIAFGTAGGQFTKTVTYPVLSGFNAAVGDLRNNGRLDIITDSQDGVSVLLNEGEGQFQDGNWTPITGGVGCTVAADFNGDGNPDLAISNGSGITIALGTGLLSKPLKQSETVAIANSGCEVTGDFNGDGIPDLLVPTPSAMLTLLGNGDATFTQAASTATSAEGYVAIADFNHDGKLDFATTGNVIAFGKGDGTFQKARAIVATPPEGGFSSIAAGDINNDGWPDLVLTNDVYGANISAYVLLNNQHGGFTQVPASFGAYTIESYLVDLNGDGNLDLVLQEQASGIAEVFLGDGKGDFTKGEVLPGTGDEEGGYVTVADVNGDGIPDVLSISGSSVVLYLGKGDGTFTQATPALGTEGLPVEVVAGQFHGQKAGAPHDLAIPDFNGGVLLLFNETKQ